MATTKFITPSLAQSSVTTESVYSDDFSRSGEYVEPILKEVRKGGEFISSREARDAGLEIRARVGPWMAFKMLFPGYIRPDEQLAAKHVLDEYDNPHAEGAEEDDEEETIARKPRQDNSLWWAKYSLLAHAQHHSPTFTRANEMVVSSWIRKAMEEDKVRRLDIAKVLPLAVRTAFLPTESDVMAIKMDNAPAVRRRYKQRDMLYWSSWFGVRRAHYESAA